MHTSAVRNSARCFVLAPTDDELLRYGELPHPVRICFLREKEGLVAATAAVAACTGSNPPWEPKSEFKVTTACCAEVNLGQVRAECFTILHTKMLF